MSKILLILSPGRQSTEALHWALHKTKEGQLDLEITFVVDKNISRNVEKTLAEVGFIGDKPGQDLSDALEKEYTERGKKILEEIEKQVRTFELKAKTELVCGNYLEICEEKANQPDVEILVVTEKKEPFYRRLFEGSESEKLRGKIDCEIKVYDADN